MFHKSEILKNAVSEKWCSDSSYLNEMFLMRDANLDNTTYNLRSVANKNFVVPLAKCNPFKGSLTYSGVIIWNIIPVSIKDSSQIFVNRCTEWLLH